ncbi:SET domain-containing protein-lysine N-methyltransferase [bacterium]|nr:SET domain-containing protein-lysine N-methyltransferase [bacterium]
MKRRFYPNSIPTNPFEPTTDKFQIVGSSEKGEGVISLTDFEIGDIVFVFNGEILSEQTLFTLQIEEGVYIHDPYVMGKVLHSCDPNTSCDIQKRTFTAIKPIKNGDFITMDYETTEDILFRPFTCGCQSPNCRGLISGKKISFAQTIVA